MCLKKNATFFQYFTVVEQFLLQFVKINKANIKNSLASLLQIPLQGQILHSFYAFQLEIPFKSIEVVLHNRRSARYIEIHSE